MSKNAELVAKKKSELEKEIAELDKQLQFYSKDVDQKKEQFKRVHDEFLSELVENYIQSEKVSLLKKLIEQKTTEVENHAEAISKKLEIVDDLAKKHSRITAERVAHSQHSASILKRMVIEEDDRFGNMHSFEDEMHNKKESVAAAIAAASADLIAKKKEYEMLAQRMKQIDFIYITPETKKQITEDCQNVLKAARKALLNLKMENRALWMKVNENI